MAGLNKREISNKALRIDSRMAKDIETLSSYTGYSQNDIIVMAIKKYMLDNRKYFVRELIEEMCLSKLTHRLATMQEDVHMVFAGMNIDIERKQDTSFYFASLSMKNKNEEIIFEDERTLDIASGELEYYKEYLFENIMKYVDFDEPEFKNYFYERFLYD